MKERRLRLLKSSPVALIFLCCLLGFAWLVHEAVVLFFEEKMSVAVSYETQEEHELPNIVFCRRRPFASGATFADLYFPESYEAVAALPDVEFQGAVTYAFSDERVAAEGNYWSVVDTVYNGRCRLFSTKRKFRPGMYLGFHIREESVPVDIFFLQPEEEVFMLWQNWGLSSKETLQVDRTLGIAMSPRYFKFLNGVRSGMNCSDDDESSFARCVAGKQGDDLRVANLSCVPPQLATLAPDLEVCKRGQDESAMQAYNVSSLSMAKAHFTCRVSCRMKYHQVTVTPFTDLPGDPWNSTERNDGIDVFPHFESSLVILNEQYVVYDLPSFVSAVGGGLGLFLGFSCLSIFTRVAEAITEAIKN